MDRTLSDDQEEEPIIIPPTLDSQHTPLPIIHDVPVRVLCDHDNLRIIFGSLSDRDRVYLRETIPITSCYKIKGWKNKFRGAYIVQIQDTLVVTLSDAKESIATSL